MNRASATSRGGVGAGADAVPSAASEAASSAEGKSAARSDADSASAAEPAARYAGPPELLAGEGLRVSHGGRTVLRVERITVRAGEILALLGPNGAGKSTLIRVLAILQKPNAGRVLFRGRGGREAEAALRGASAAVLQRPHVWAGSVRWNLGLGQRLRGGGGYLRQRFRGGDRESLRLRFRGGDRHESRESEPGTTDRITAIARQLGLEALLEADARQLSGGETQRVALARALVLEPEVLFLDEPTASLDAEARRALREDLERLARAHARTTLLATHDRSEAFQLADRVAVLSEGRIVQIGTPAELFENPRHPFIAEVTGAEFTLRGRSRGGDDGLIQVDASGETLLARGGAHAGIEVKVAYRPEDLLLSRTAPEPGSARNRLVMRVAEVRPVGGLIRVRLQGPPDLIAVVTRAAAGELGLAAGVSVHVQVKATALHAFPV